MKQKKRLAGILGVTLALVLMVMPLFSSMVYADDGEDDATVGAPGDTEVVEQQLLPLTAPQALDVSGYVSYAAWNDDDDRDEGYVYIYPLQNNTNIELWATSNTAPPIQIDTLVASWANAPAGQPISFGPLTNQQYFFKLINDKPVTWELSTESYYDFRDSSRFVIASSLNYLGTLFYFHADQEAVEEVNVINPGLTGSGTVQLDRWDGVSTWIPVANIADIAADNYGEFQVPQKAFYRVTSQNPVLVYEGRYLSQNMATGVTPEGDTVGNTVFAATLDHGWGYPPNIVLHIMGVTAASYTVYQRTPTTSWSVVTTGSVALGGLTSETILSDNVLFQVETSSPDEKVCVQYIDNSSGGPGGGEMIPGIDGGDTTNPGTQFLVGFSNFYQDYIDIIAPQSGTSVTITGPTPANYLTTVADEGIHFAPGNNAGLYTITSTNPVWVVVNSLLGDQQSYFVYPDNREEPEEPEEPEIPVEVGGEVSSVNKAALLTPWIAIAAAILVISCVTLTVRRRINS